MHIEDMDEDENPGMTVQVSKDIDPEKDGNKELITANHSAIQEGGEIYVQKKRVSVKLAPMQNYPKVKENPFENPF